MVEESSAVSSRKKGVGLMSGERGCCCSRLVGKPGLRAVEPAGGCTEDNWDEGNSDDGWMDEGAWDDDTGVADWDDEGACCGDENEGVLLSPTTGERGGMSRTKGEKSDRSVGLEDCGRSREIGVEVKLK